MLDVLRGVFWLAGLLVFGLCLAVCLVLVFVLVCATGWVNRRFDECFGDW